MRATVATYPAVNLEFLVQGGLLDGRGLRARRRRREAPRRLPEDVGACGDERLHGEGRWWTRGEAERTAHEIEEGVASGRASYPGLFGRIPPTQSRAPNFPRRPVLERSLVTVVTVLAIPALVRSILTIVRRLTSVRPTGRKKTLSTRRWYIWCQNGIHSTTVITRGFQTVLANTCGVYC